MRGRHDRRQWHAQCREPLKHNANRVFPVMTNTTVKSSWRALAWLLTCPFLLPALALGQEADPRIAARVEEISSWSAADGTWEGKYVIEAAPEELMREGEEDRAPIGIRIIRERDDASVHIQWNEGDEWDAIGSESYLTPDNIGWHILLTSEGGVWLERWHLTFMRVEEDVADFVVTRTVHNWLVIDGMDVPVTYYVFGAGQVTRTERP